ncbi:phage tail protein [Citrobacter cronae]|nr:phage tail protein [Citrobacter cronae]MDE9718502.1 phage tail protein [Citrobacter cronae]
MRVAEGEEGTSIQFAVTLYPAIIGGCISLRAVGRMANDGRAEGTGNILGMYIIDKVSTIHIEFFSDDTVRKIDFTLSLKRGDKSLVAMFSDLSTRRLCTRLSVASGHCGSDKIVLNAHRVWFFYVLRKVAVKINHHFIASQKQDNKKATR